MHIERQPGLIVYLCGLGTSALALYGVRLLADHGENIMGWYANGILPVGALLVGMASGLGFALASRYLNVRLTRSYVLGMLTTGLLDYVAAQYLTYQNLLETHHLPEDRYSFFRYIQDLCENMTFKSSGSSTPGSPLGAFGYFFKLLEMAGFAAGCMIPAAALFKMPYCKGCQRYLLAHRSGFVSSTAQRAAVLKQPKAARRTSLDQSVHEVASRAQALAERMQGQPLAQTVSVLEEADRAAAKAAAAWVAVALKKCPSCDAHHVAFTLHNATVDKKRAATSLLVLDKTAAPAAPAA